MFFFRSISVASHCFPVSAGFLWQVLQRCVHPRYLCDKSSKTGVSFIPTPRNWLGLWPSIQLKNYFEVVEFFSSNWWFPCQWKAGARKRLKLSFYDCLVFSWNVKQLTAKFFSEGFDKTGFLPPIDMSLSKAASTDKIVNLKNSTSCSFFSTTPMDDVSFVDEIHWLYHILLRAHKAWSNQQCIPTSVREIIWMFKYFKLSIKTKC